MVKNGKIEMNNFLTINEKKISKEFEEKGFLIRDIEDLKSLNKLKFFFLNLCNINLKTKNDANTKNDILNLTHKKIRSNNLNKFRLKIINEINKKKEIRELYYKISKPILDAILGNELSMQSRVNLSIQLPNDKSSLLPVHSDVWSGDSPFETVVWLPLVDCYKTKSMFILPPKKYEKIKKIFLQKKFNSSEMIYKKIKKDLIWINIKFGQVLVFNQCLPHGNTVNHEKETRWSLNCRFKSIFSPHRDKKIGEFFEPITLRKVSELAINYKLPKIK